MSAASIQAKVKKLLARAIVITGSATSEKVYLVRKSTTAGTPVSPGVTTTTTLELVNALFTNYDAKYLDANILAGDRKLVCDNAHIVQQGDIVTQGALNYTVVNVAIIAPTSDVLLYMPQLRLQ
jgi:hypothetical protein